MGFERVPDWASLSTDLGLYDLLRPPQLPVMRSAPPAIATTSWTTARVDRVEPERVCLIPEEPDQTDLERARSGRHCSPGPVGGRMRVAVPG